MPLTSLLTSDISHASFWPVLVILEKASLLDLGRRRSYAMLYIATHKDSCSPFKSEERSPAVLFHWSLSTSLAECVFFLSLVKNPESINNSTWSTHVSPPPTSLSISKYYCSEEKLRPWLGDVSTTPSKGSSYSFWVRLEATLNIFSFFFFNISYKRLQHMQSHFPDENQHPPPTTKLFLAPTALSLLQ